MSPPSARTRRNLTIVAKVLQATPRHALPPLRGLDSDARARLQRAQGRAHARGARDRDSGAS
eukprot:1282731-Pleurochrysis_carterae.AAC.1